LDKKRTTPLTKEEKEAYILEQLKKAQPHVDKRVKTEDVTATKGSTFKDFNLSNELQLGIYEMGYEAPSPI